MKIKYLKIIVVISTLTAMSACSTVGNPPNALLSQAQIQIEAAKQSDSEKYAPLALRSAQQNFEEANKAISHEEYETAARLLEKAIADAKYANAKTQAEKAQKASSELDASLDELKKAL